MGVSMNKIELARMLGLELYSADNGDSFDFIFSLPCSEHKWGRKYFTITEVMFPEEAWNKAADKVVFALQKQVVFNMGKELREEAY